MQVSLPLGQTLITGFLKDLDPKSKLKSYSGLSEKYKIKIKLEK